MKKTMKKTKQRSKNAARKKTKLMKISKNMTFAEIMQKYPKAAEILMEKGLHCIGCHMAMHETLEQGAIMHGLNPEKLVNEINIKLSKTEKSQK